VYMEKCQERMFAKTENMTKCKRKLTVRSIRKQ